MSEISIEYLIMAYRYGNMDYFFPVGIFHNKADAIKAAKNHAEYRGGKYSHKMYEMITEYGYDAEEVHGEWVTGI